MSKYFDYHQQRMMTYFKNMYIKAEFKKEIQLIIDVETRWNSLHFMLGRFDKLRHCVMKSLIDLKSNIVFDEIEMNSINDGTCYVSC